MTGLTAVQSHEEDGRGYFAKTKRYGENEGIAWRAMKPGHMVGQFDRDYGSETSSIACDRCGARGTVNHEGLGPVGLIFVSPCEEVRRLNLVS